MAADENEGFKFANLVNTNNARATLFGFLADSLLGFLVHVRCNAAKVRMIARFQPATSMAFATGPKCWLKRLAKQQRGNLFGEGALADSGRTYQKDCVRKPVNTLPEQLLLYMIVPAYSI